MNKIQKYDNLHIVLWLIKDMCWSIDNKLGVILVLPTILISIWIFSKSKNISAWYHNLAVCFWITANSLWMVSELFKFEDITKPYVIILFIIGLIILAFYYLKYSIKWRKSTN